jgi:predicted MFS family arabinose efflux permease
MLAGLGVILPELRLERDLPRSEAALYPSGFAAGLVVVGLVGDRIARCLGRYAVPAAVAALAGGVVLLMLGTGRLDTGLGAVVMGLGGAGLVQLVPAELRTQHGERGAVAIGEANATASCASVLAPLLVGVAIGAELGWRAAFAVVPLASAVLIAVLLNVRRGPDGVDRIADRELASDRAPRGFWAWWLVLVLVVSVEFCFLFWSADFLRTVTELPATLATGASAGFVLGMAIGRVAVSPVLKVLTDPVRVLVTAAVVAMLGFALFWTAAVPVLAVAGLVMTGLGVALLYPVALAEALASWPSRPIRAAGRCALASGLAVGSAPVLLGALADTAGLRAAFWLAPALLTVLLAGLARIHRIDAENRPGEQAH